MGRGHTHTPGLCLPELMVPEINPVHNQKDCSNRPHTQVLRSTHTLPWYLGCTSDHSFKKAPVSEWLSEWVPVCHIPSLDTSESYIHKANYVTQQKLRIHSCEFSLLLLFSPSVPSLRTQGLQDANLPCPSPSPGVYSNSCSLSLWCHPTISSSVAPLLFFLPGMNEHCVRQDTSLCSPALLRRREEGSSITGEEMLFSIIGYSSDSTYFITWNLTTENILVTHNLKPCICTGCICYISY